MIEMHYMVVRELRDHHHIADQLRIFRDGIVQGILHGAHRRDPVHQRANAADPLRERPRIARVTVP